MTDAATLLALAGRVEKLTGPCRETDVEIYRLIFPFPAVSLSEMAQDRFDREKAPKYTSSLDAAMTLRLDWMSIELTESAANDSTSDPRFTRCRIWDWRRGPLAFDRTNEWKAEGNRPLPLNIVWAILHARAAQASSVPATGGE